MKTIHRTLHLQHHAHTGKRLHHRHTSYRGLAIILLLSGGFIIGLNNLAHVTADSLYVSATNPAPIPSQPAIITGPPAGKVSQPQTDISGYCPRTNPRVIIEILLDSVSVGSTTCTSTNSFSLPVTVSSGQHTAIARIHTITNGLGTDSKPFTLNATYATFQPTNVAAKKPTTKSVPPVQSSLNIVAVNPFIVFGPGQDAVWQGTISGGKLPYSIVVNWGDNNTVTIAAKTEAPQSFTHQYKAMHSYDITMQVTDASGAQLIRHFSAVTPYIASPSAPTSAKASGGSSSGDSNSSETSSPITTLRKIFNNSALVGAYSTLFFVVAVFAVLWHRNPSFIYAKVPVHHAYKPMRRKAAHSHR